VAYTRFAILEASNETHVRKNARSLEIQLTAQDLAGIDRPFPPPRSKQTLVML